jgi:hypothetical protein
MGDGGSSRGASSSGWGRVLIAGKKGEAGGEPKSQAKGQRPPRDSWETELCAKQMRWEKEDRVKYSAGGGSFMQRFQNRHQLSISPLLCALCPQVVVCWVPVVSKTAANRAERNSGTALEWMTSGEPRLNQMASKSGGMNVGAVRSLRWRPKAVLVKLSMTAK